MANHDEVVKCPLCQGEAELRRSELIERLTKPDFAFQMKRTLAETSVTAEAAGELVGAKAGRGEAGTFQKEVHSWNPQLSIFNRSPKE